MDPLILLLKLASITPSTGDAFADAFTCLEMAVIAVFPMRLLAIIRKCKRKDPGYRPKRLLIIIFAAIILGTASFLALQAPAAIKEKPAQSSTPEAEEEADFHSPLKQYSKCCNNCVVIGRALDAYGAQHNKHYPKSLQELVPEYLPAVPRCPKTHTDTYSDAYQIIEVSRGTWYMFYCSGENHSDIGLPKDFPRYNTRSTLIERPGDDFLDLDLSQKYIRKTP